MQVCMCQRVDGLYVCELLVIDAQGALRSISESNKAAPNDRAAG